MTVLDFSVPLVGLLGYAVSYSLWKRRHTTNPAWLLRISITLHISLFLSVRFLAFQLGVIYGPNIPFSSWAIGIFAHILFVIFAANLKESRD